MDGTLAVWVNMEDHLKLVSYRSDACLQEAFKTICINVLKVYFNQLPHTISCCYVFCEKTKGPNIEP